jgi:gamma-glutamyltranspeptidase/glutathione hydrolase
MPSTTSLNADYVSHSIGRSQTRRWTIATRGIVAAESTLAAQAGAVVLARGGHAVDAAIAANAVMGRRRSDDERYRGDLFAIVQEGRTGTLHG